MSNNEEMEKILKAFGKNKTDEEILVKHYGENHNVPADRAKLLCSSLRLYEKILVIFATMYLDGSLRIKNRRKAFIKLLTESYIPSNLKDRATNSYRYYEEKTIDKEEVFRWREYLGDKETDEFLFLMETNLENAKTEKGRYYHGITSFEIPEIDRELFS